MGIPASPGHEAPVGVMVGWDVPVPAGDEPLQTRRGTPAGPAGRGIVAKRPRVEGFSFSGSVAIKVSAKPWHEDDRRSSALFQIQAVVEAWPNAFGLARLCRTLDGLDFEELTYSIEASVSHKATSTIVRRLSSLTHYVKWSSATSITPFPVTEKAAWADTRACSHLFEAYFPHDTCWGDEMLCTCIRLDCIHRTSRFRQ